MEEQKIEEHRIGHSGKSKEIVRGEGYRLALDIRRQCR